jgi:CUB/sushi domain-containing protein
VQGEQGASVTCPPLENPEHGTILIDGFTPNQTASYECDTGFQMQGPSQLLCNSDGKWIVIVDMDVDASTAEGSNETFKPVELSSSSTVGTEQQSDSEVTTPTAAFLCEPVFCTDPQPPVNGSVRFTSLSFGSKAIFSCDKGFVLNGSQVFGSHYSTFGNLHIFKSLFVVDVLFLL